jgi:hypothetical protein
MVSRRRAVLTFLVACSGLSACGGSGDDRGDQAVAYCRDTVQEACNRAFGCSAPVDRGPDFTARYGSTVEECPTVLGNCELARTTCPKFDAERAAACLSQFRTEDCADAVANDPNGPVVALPYICMLVCMPP